jgi:uncharacterized membrane protein
MSDLIVVGFNNELKADEVLVTLEKLQHEHLVDLEDAAIVVKTQKGRLRIKQTYDLVGSAAFEGSFWGLLLGVLFLHPLVGVVAGIASGAIAGSLVDLGISDDFMRELGKTLQPGTSALFILVRHVTPDKVLEALRPFDGKILHTSLSRTDEAMLRKAFRHAQDKMVA